MRTGERIRSLLAAMALALCIAAPAQGQDDILRIESVDHDSRTLVVRGESLRVPTGIPITLETAAGYRQPIGFRDLARRQYVRLEMRGGRVAAITVIESPMSGEGML